MTLGWALATSRLNIVRTVGGSWRCGTPSRSPVSSVGTAGNSDYGKGMRPPR